MLVIEMDRIMMKELTNSILCCPHMPLMGTTEHLLLRVSMEINLILLSFIRIELFSSSLSFGSTLL